MSFNFQSPKTPGFRPFTPADVPEAFKVLNKVKILLILFQDLKLAGCAEKLTHIDNLRNGFAHHLISIG